MTLDITLTRFWHGFGAILHRGSCSGTCVTWFDVRELPKISYPRVFLTFCNPLPVYIVFFFVFFGYPGTKGEKSPPAKKERGYTAILSC